MAYFPVRCDTCHRWYTSRGAIAADGNLGDVTMIRNKVTCPFCGEWGSIQNGVYRTTNDVLELVDAGSAPAQDLRAALQLLRRAKRRGWTHDRILQELNQPSASPLMHRIRDVLVENRELAPWIMPIIITLLGAALQKPAQVHIHVDTDQVIERLLEEREEASLEGLLEFPHRRPAKEPEQTPKAAPVPEADQTCDEAPE